MSNVFFNSLRILRSDETEDNNQYANGVFADVSGRTRHSRS